ncbi:hypothetical protein [Nevskia soli]|uniref:hypothetical protein n=1 Tax=Nevskia soli TaxID=418856 RepID=UPI0015D7F0B0|nr:hypothetical protein [Nevskia soli]
MPKKATKRKPSRTRRSSPIQAVDSWFKSRGWTSFAFQREVWDAYRRGESGLIHAVPVRQVSSATATASLIRIV